MEQNKTCPGTDKAEAFGDGERQLCQWHYVGKHTIRIVKAKHCIIPQGDEGGP